MLGDTIKFAGFTFFAFIVLAEGATKFVTRPAADHAPSAAPAPVPTRAAFINAPVSALDEHRVLADAQGHYHANVLVNGQNFPMLVDTGATSVALKSEDAAALNIYPQSADFKYATQTANGVGHVARVKLREVQIGAISLYDVEALVCEPGMLSESLLGMTFLSRLSRVDMQSGALLLRK